MRTEGSVLLIVALALVGCEWLYPSLVVRVENSTGVVMEETGVAIVGDASLIGRVSAAEVGTGRLRPKSDSGMVLSFKDGSGRICRQKLDVWVDNGFGGDLRLIVNNCESTKVTGMPGRPMRGPFYAKAAVLFLGVPITIVGAVIVGIRRSRYRRARGA
jgi:hypothetical protein